MQKCVAGADFLGDFLCASSRFNRCRRPTALFFPFSDSLVSFSFLSRFSPSGIDGPSMAIFSEEFLASIEDPDYLKI